MEKKWKWQRGRDGYIVVKDSEIVAYAKRLPDKTWDLYAFGGRGNNYKRLADLKAAAERMNFSAY
jgi:hypothetical protein